MANFTAGTSFSDGVTNDVTAAKLNALVADAVPTSNLSLNSTTGTIATFNSTTGTIASLNSTTGTIATLNSTTGTIATFNSTTGTIASLNSTTGTIATLNSTTGTIPTLVATTLITTGTGTAASPAIVPTGDSNTGIFFPAADTIAFSEGGAEAVRINSSGNFGIGTASPSKELQINATEPTIRLEENGAGSKRLELSVNSSGEAKVFATQSGSTLLLGTVGTGRLLIDSSGNVGIGTASPSYKLQVTSNTNDALISASGTADNIGLRVSNTQTGGGTYRILAPATGSGYPAGSLVFEDQAVGARMTIDSSGNVGIGMTPTAQLELSTDSAKKPSTNTWTIASDQRLKTNITNADNDRCYEIVKQVPLKRYTWKSEVYSQEQVKDRSKLGWIAQDVEAVFPKAVGTNRFAYNQVFEDVITPELDSDGNAVLDENGVAKTKTEKRLVSEEVIEDCKDLNSDQIYAAMYGTIQKLIEKVETLEAKVAALEAA